MKKYIIYILTVFVFSNSSCEEFVEIDSPNFQITNKNVFANESTAVAAIQGIYNELRPAFFTGALSTHLGMSGNLIEPRISSLKYHPFYFHEINTIDAPDAMDNLNIWSSAYNIIYLTNSLIEGVQNSSSLSIELNNSLIGQALVIRAFTYFYLTNIYGAVPLLLSTDYKENSIASRTSIEDVWLSIRTDLEEATKLLESNNTYPESERYHVTQNVAIALLARVYLYLKDWTKAESYSSQIIQQSSTYKILNDLNQVFIKNNQEAIWQIDPSGGAPLIVTSEGIAYVIRTFLFGVVQGEIQLTPNFIKNFSTNDKRLVHWIGKFEQENRTYSYINKYKEYAGNSSNKEASVVLRLSEQYLIRSEARLHQGKLDLAINDIDVIRERAGLDLIADKYPGINQQSLMDTIMEERKKELFGEYGHYWLDLKRNMAASNEFAETPTWEETDIWYPIPEQERFKNPNLGQNDGY